MAERVYYHHKKAAAGAMLVKLVELVGFAQKPRDDEKIYPAPWTVGVERIPVPHMTHLSDQELIDHLGTVTPDNREGQPLQRYLHAALRYRRADIYRTLLVVDGSMADASSHSISYIATELRGDKDAPSSEGRLSLEARLEKAAEANPGEILIYCPSPSMQSKVVDARLEIKEGRVLPLRVQTDSFAYRADLEVLQQYYSELWRAYVFIAPRLFEDPVKCNAIVDAFCKHFGIPVEVAYRKVRLHDFATLEIPVMKMGFETVHQFVQNLPIDGVPAAVIAAFLHQIAEDEKVSTLLSSGADSSQRLSALFQIATLKNALANPDRLKRIKKPDVNRIDRYCDSLLLGERPYQVAAREGQSDYKAFVDHLIEGVLSGRTGPGFVQ